MADIRNIRFPHRCTIYETVGATPFKDGEKLVVWTGRCRNEDRTFSVRDDVPKTSYMVQLGALIGGDLPGDADAAYQDDSGKEVGAKVMGLRPGLIIDVEDAQCSLLGNTITEIYCGQLGTSVYFGDPKT